MKHDLCGKKVLVTGATGLLGRPLVDLLLKRGALVTGTGVEFVPPDWPENVGYQPILLGDGAGFQPVLFEAYGPFEYVFHLAGAKGGVGIGRTRAADFFLSNVKSLTSFLGFLVGAQSAGALKRFLYVSSVGAYPGHLEQFNEDRIWDGPPHESDFFGGCAKRFGEVLCAAYRTQFGLDYVTVRPTNCFGPYDRFDPETGMVIAALIARIEAGESPLVVWGNGKAERDFLYSKDAAEQMVTVMEKGQAGEAYNLGTGYTRSIEDLLRALKVQCYPSLKWEFDESKPSGPAYRCMSMRKLRAINDGVLDTFADSYSLPETVEWYRAHRNYVKYDPFK